MTRGVLVTSGAALLLALACSSTPFSYDASRERIGDAGAPSLPLNGSGGSFAAAGAAALPGAGDDDGGASSNEGGAASGGEAPNGTAGAAGTDGGVVATCPELPGEKLVLAGSFCIDESEVTAAHYQAFVASQPSPSEQPYECLGNLSFQNGCQFAEPEKQPVRCVDWCDARAYCESVGKRLCGSSERTAGDAMPFDASASDPNNQWYAACSHAGEAAYPYGDAYDASACWGADRPVVGVAAIKSAKACVGGYEGLFDMSGGVAEWVDSCSAAKGMSDACHIRGGSYAGTSEQLRCDWQSATPRDTSSNYIGFRCCASLAE